MQPLGKSGSHPIVFDPSIWAALAQQQQPRPQPMPVQSQQKKSHGGFLSSLISEVGGAGGAAGGAAAGAAAGSVVPGIGTAIGGLAGAILGGFAGGTGGRLVENKVRDNKYNVGSALKEGGLDAALSGVGGAFQLAKGARAVGALTKAAPEATGIAQAPARVGGLERAGFNLKASAGGYSTGARLNGEKIGMAQSKQVDNLLNKLRIPSGSPEFRQAQLEGQIGNLNNTLTNLYGKNVQRVQPNALGQQILTDVNKLPLLDNAAKKSAQDFVGNQLKSVKNTNDLWELRKSIDANKIKFGGSPSAKLVDREAVARVIRNNIKDILDKKLPGVANTNSLYHDAVNANELLKNISTNSGGGLISKVANLSPVRAVESKAGSTIEKAGKLSAGTGGKASQITAQAKLQAPASLTRAISGLGQVQSSPEQSQANDMTMPQDTQQLPYYDPSDPFGQGSQLTSAYSAGSSPDSQDPASLYGEQNLMADITRDPKHTGDYLNLYKTLSTLSQSQAKADKTSGLPGNVGKLSAQQYYSAQQGLQALDQLTGVLSKNPSLYTKTSVPGQTLPVVGGLVQKSLGTNTYNTYARNIADLLLRARTGATANAQEINMYMHELLPQAGDDPSTAQAKIQQLRQNFQDIVSAGGTMGGNSSPDTSSLYGILSQMQGAY